MIRDGNAEVGCALISYNSMAVNAIDSTEEVLKSMSIQYLFTCDYAQDSLVDQEIYDIGAACSRCQSYGNEYRCDEK